MSLPKDPILLYEGEVVDVDDKYTGRRIKVRMASDKETVDELPWCFPLMPKMINVMPKVGEVVLVLTSRADPQSNRFYIGPVISQFQEMAYAPYNSGTGDYNSLYSDREDGVGCQEGLEQYASRTDGAFPDKQSVSLIGRNAEDISLNDGNVIIRSGARVDVSEDTGLQGKVGFDNTDTAFIKLEKNEDGIDTPSTDTNESVTKSVCVIGADKTYIMSRHNTDTSSAIDEYDSKEMVLDEKIADLQNAMHSLPYGDKLVSFLNDLKDAMLHHTHPWADDEPYVAYGVDKVKEHDYSQLLSPNVFIS